MLSGVIDSTAERRIIVGFHENTPLIFTDSDDQVKGIAVDLLTHIAGKEGWKIQYLPGSYTQCIQRLETGVIDILPGMAVSQSTQGRFTVSQATIIDNWGQLYISTEADFSDILDFHDKDVAVVEADIYFQFFETILDKFDIHPRFVRVDDYGKVLSLVHQKKVTAGIVPRLYGTYYQGRFRINKSPISFRPTELGFGVSNGPDDSIIRALDHHLKRLKNNPNSIFYRSLDRWTQGVQKVTFPLWLRPLWVIGIAAGILGMIIVATVILRRQVKLRTETLKTTIADKV
jgi:ABC-type amino acid transport substrate-binding protein